MTNGLEFDDATETDEPHEQWGMHNGVVVLAALGLVALSVLLGWLPQTDLFARAPIWAISFLSSMGFVLMLAAGSVIGMLVATRMLQAHVGPRGARMLALGGIVALVLALLLQTGLVALRVTWQTGPQVLTPLTVQIVANFVAGMMAVGAAMIALAFVGRRRA